jgi:hypothetical protein
MHALEAAAARRSRKLERRRARPGLARKPCRVSPDPVLGPPRRRWRSASRRSWSPRWRPRWAGALAHPIGSYPTLSRDRPAGAGGALRGAGGAGAGGRAGPARRRARGPAGRAAGRRRARRARGAPVHCRAPARAAGAPARRPAPGGGAARAPAAPAAAEVYGGHASQVCGGRDQCSQRPAGQRNQQAGFQGNVAADGGRTAARWQPAAQAAGCERRRCGTNTRTGRWRPGCRASTGAWRRPRRPRRAGPPARCRTSTRRCRCACSPRCSRAWTGRAARGWRPRSRPVRPLPRPATRQKCVSLQLHRAFMHTRAGRSCMRAPVPARGRTARPRRVLSLAHALALQI